MFLGFWNAHTLGGGGYFGGVWGAPRPQPGVARGRKTIHFFLWLWPVTSQNSGTVRLGGQKLSSGNLGGGRIKNKKKNKIKKILTKPKGISGGECLITLGAPSKKNSQFWPFRPLKITFTTHDSTKSIFTVHWYPPKEAPYQKRKKSYQTVSKKSSFLKVTSWQKDDGQLGSRKALLSFDWWS